MTKYFKPPRKRQSSKDNRGRNQQTKQQSAIRRRAKLPTKREQLARKSVGRVQTLSASTAKVIRQLNAGFEDYLDFADSRITLMASKALMLEDRKRLEWIDGLFGRIGINLEGNSVLSDGYTFGAADLRMIPEDSFLIKQLYEAGSPLLRLDVARMGSSDVNNYTRWAESRIEQRKSEAEIEFHDWLESLKAVAAYISEHQLSWKSTIVWPEEYFPDYIRDRYIKQKEEDIYVDGVERGALELDEFKLWVYLLGLFKPYSDFNPDAVVRFQAQLFRGRSPFAALTPDTMFISRWGIESGGGAFHRTLNITGLGADQHPEGRLHPLFQGKYLLRNTAWLRDWLLPAIEAPGEEIRIASTIVGVEEHAPGHFEKHERDAGLKVALERASKTVPKHLKGDPDAIQKALDEEMDEPEYRDHIAREVAINSIKKQRGVVPFRQSVVLSAAGESKAQVSGLYDRVIHYLDQGEVLYKPALDELEHWENLLAFLPDIRQREVTKYTQPIPSDDAAVIFRRLGRPPVRRGALVGYYTRYREPLIIPLGGNYFLVGSTGSGKSMAVKYLIYRLLPLSDRWVFRLMNNTNLGAKSIEEAPGWTGLVERHDGLVLFGGNEEFDDPNNFQKRLDRIWEEETRVVLFHSVKSRPHLDEIWLEWLTEDITRTPPGVVAVDETVHWFTRKDDLRAKLWVYELMNLFRRNNKLSVTTIQSLGVIRNEQKGVWSHLLTLIDAGKFAFYTPLSSELPEDFGLSEKAHPEAARFLMDTVASFKTEPLGPLKKPGYAVLASENASVEVKFEVDLKTLAELARKKMNLEVVEEDELWGL